MSLNLSPLGWLSSGSPLSEPFIHPALHLNGVTESLLESVSSVASPLQDSHTVRSHAHNYRQLQGLQSTLYVFTQRKAMRTQGEHANLREMH